MAVDDYSATITDIIRGARPADMSLKRVSDPRNGGMRPVRSGFDAKLAQAQPAEFDSQKLADAGYGGRPSQPTITQDDRARYSAETFRPAARKGAFEHGSSVAMASREAGAAPAGGSAVEAANVAARMLEVEQQFQGVQSRHYGPQDLVWNGPSPSLGNMKGTGASVIRNPITGGPMVTQPGQTPQMFLRALNQMARAKSEAQANVIRGAESDRAFARAMEQAFGVPEGVLQGLSPDQARSVGEQMQQTNQYKAQQEEQVAGRQREQRGVMDFAQSLGTVDPQAAAEASRQSSMGGARDVFERLSEANKAQQAEKGQGALATITGELDLLEPEEAARTALQKIMATGIFKATANEPRMIAQHYQQRAQGMAKQKVIDDRAAEKTAADEAKATRTEDMDRRKVELEERKALQAEIEPSIDAAMKIVGSALDGNFTQSEIMAGRSRNQMPAKRIAAQRAVRRVRSSLSSLGMSDEEVDAIISASLEASGGGNVESDSIISPSDAAEPKPKATAEAEDAEINGFLMELSANVSRALRGRRSAVASADAFGG